MRNFENFLQQNLPSGVSIILVFLPNPLPPVCVCINAVNDVYSTEIRNPTKGYISYLIEMKYPTGTVSPMTFSTSAFVIPDKFPCGPPQ